MKPVRNPVLAAVVVAAAVLAAAGPVGRAVALPVVPVARQAAVAEPAQLVCGPYRCFRRPFWRYGDGRGFFPMRRFGPPPVRRFGYRPFGFGRFGGPRRW